jgi:hypothetical protein
LRRFFLAAFLVAFFFVAFLVARFLRRFAICVTSFLFKKV